jgi:nucleotide-binding universal stress UspA family protein
MSIRTVLVNVDTDSDDPVNYAASLAQAFGAALLGVAADQPLIAFGGVDAYKASLDHYAIIREGIERQLEAAEERFRRSIPAGMESHWLPRIGDVSELVVEAALRADLIVTTHQSTGAFPQSSDVDLGRIILGSGRPVLVVADESAAFNCERIVVGWKDTREARRALVDALPFLDRARDVRIITISEGDAGAERHKLKEVLAWLDAHGVAASDELIESEAGFVDVLESTARASQADLVVAGGYGHSRMRELLFGGMTRNLIAARSLNRLFSN